MVATPSLQLPRDTARLRLRLHEPQDSTWLQRIYSREDVCRFLLEDPWTTADAEKQVAERIEKSDLAGAKKALALVIDYNGMPIGDVALWLTDVEHGVAEIGWVLDPEFSGKGFAREAVTEVIRIAFDVYGLHRVVAQMDARNTASAKLAAAVGMRKEAHFRQDWWNKGEWTDTLVFAMLSSDRR